MAAERWHRSLLDSQCRPRQAGLYLVAKPAQRSIGKGGYFRNLCGSSVARPHSQKLEPLAETTSRACWQSTQRPTRDLSRALMGGRGSRESTLSSLKSGESGQREAKALEKLSNPAHGCSFSYGPAGWADVCVGGTSIPSARQRFSPTLGSVSRVAPLEEA